MLDYWLLKDLKDVDEWYVGYLSSKTFLRAEAGRFGKFVRLQQNDRWIAFNIATWNFLREMTPHITAAVEGKTGFSSTMCAKKGVCVIHYRGVASVVFKVGRKATTGAMGDLTINLDFHEWQQFVAVSPVMDERLNDVSVYSSFQNDWRIFKSACGAYALRHRLIPKLMDETISLLLSAHLSARMIHTKVLQSCVGYGIHFPSQKQHTSMNCVCLRSWQEQVEQFFGDVKHTVDVKSAAAMLNETMNWKIKPTPISDDLQSLVQNDKLGDIVTVYVKLFDDLGLYNHVQK